ncbi:hypothetical protein [Burkholderia multivorans]|uniref:hypothetical protein n=1 Tax=Burkholderia multivorans TaxID=87883 RepID=UPI0013DFEA32|nr:hypothetical protein [Burkholderia multivorans]MBU9618507.1 hypothetical protein [Burkholderia multivorans]NGM75370.1 hypothetical protein [Burkholderia multivorans]
MSDPIHQKAGDATLHAMAVIHAAPEITTDEPRWVYRLQLAMLCRPKESRPEMRHYYFAPTRRDAIETKSHLSPHATHYARRAARRYSRARPIRRRSLSRGTDDRKLLNGLKESIGKPSSPR